MTSVVLRLRRDPGLALVALAIVAAVALYAPTLGHGLVNYDDPWLVRDNWLLQQHSVRAIVFDLGVDTRATLGAEYLPVRDLSIALDFAVWGDWFQGFHLTNLLVYLASIALWFAALARFGIDRRLAGLVVLLWAIHPAHAESVAWLSERKGLLAMMFVGAAAYGYSQYRVGRSARWLALAVVAAAFAVWSKAPAAFAIASFAAFELLVPAKRASMRRALVGLGAIAVVTIAAFVPVLIVASKMSVIAADDHGPANSVAMVLGLHGFYLRLAALGVANSVSYPIATDGPATLDIVLGCVGLLVVLAVLIARGRVSPVLRAAAAVWLLGWFPVSRILLPVQSVVLADRYLLFPTLGVALAVALGICALDRPQLRWALAGVVVLASALRTLDAQSTWRDSRTLWERAVESNPHDSKAWSLYVDALDAANERERAAAALERAIEVAPSSRLLLRQALLVIHDDRARGIELMRKAAEAGEPRAMTNLALLLSESGQPTEALEWARRAVERMPAYANGYRILGKVALDAKLPAEALAAFERAYTLEPRNMLNRLNLAVALIQNGRPAEARGHLEACLADPALADRARKLLSTLP